MAGINATYLNIYEQELSLEKKYTQGGLKEAKVFY